MSTLQEILQNIEENAPMTIDEILREEIKEWEKSDERKLMLLGQKYYRVKNKILERTRQVIDAQGKLSAVKNLADNRIPHGFVRKLVDQKTGYLLSRPFLPKTEDKTYQDLLDGYFDEGFKRMLKNTGKDAINCGKAWLQVYYNEQGDLSFMRIPPHEVIPIWRDTAHTELDAVIRVYEVTMYEAKQKKIIRKAEFWDTSGVRLYEAADGGEFRFLETKGHFAAVSKSPEGEDVENPMSWEQVPFICFKYNDEEQPLIDIIQKMVDDYDRNRSDNSNNLEDLPNSTYVVKDYDGTDAASFRKNVSQYRVIFVRGDGDVKTIALQLDTEAHKMHIEQTRKDIYEFGRGVDTQSERFGNSPSGVALKHLYADLDLDANDIESEFQASLNRLLWFIDTHIYNTTQKDFSEEKVTFIFNRDMAINESEIVTNAKDSVGIISNKTIVANHPWVTNTDDEIKQLEEEQAEDQKRFDKGQYDGLEDEPS